MVLIAASSRRNGDTQFAKVFWCNPWMVYQCKEFQDMSTRLLQDIDMIVYGDGMIAYMIETSAKIAELSGDEEPLPDVSEKEDVGAVCYAPMDRFGNVVMEPPEGSKLASNS
jgi:hypothetical protein